MIYTFLYDITETQLSKFLLFESWETNYFPRSNSSLPSLKELSTNRSLDNLDCLVSPVEAPQRHRHSDFSHCSSTLGRNTGAQVCSFLPLIKCVAMTSQRLPRVHI